MPRNGLFPWFLALSYFFQPNSSLFIFGVDKSCEPSQTVEKWTFHALSLIRKKSEKHEQKQTISDTLATNGYLLNLAPEVFQRPMHVYFVRHISERMTEHDFLFSLIYSEVITQDIECMPAVVRGVLVYP